MARSDHRSARPFLPDDRSLDSLARAADGCQGCPLYKGASQTVFGEGPANAQLMLVGEQPGTKEDQTGKPFVGPAGEVLDRALDEAGLDRNELFITNAVKHYKSGSDNESHTRLKPTVGEIRACRPWLEAEIQALRPQIIVAMGAVAARSLSGQAIAIGEVREQWLQTVDGRDLFVTYHPSAALQAPASIDRERIFDALVDDLRRAKDYILSTQTGPRPGAQ